MPSKAKSGSKGQDKVSCQFSLNLTIFPPNSTNTPSSLKSAEPPLSKATSTESLLMPLSHTKRPSPVDQPVFQTKCSSAP